MIKSSAVAGSVVQSIANGSRQQQTMRSAEGRIAKKLRENQKTRKMITLFISGGITGLLKKATNKQNRNMYAQTLAHHKQKPTSALDFRS